MSETLYQLKITLKNISPLIWRRILIDPVITLFDFHRVLQTVMGWSNSQLHNFIKNETVYSIPGTGSNEKSSRAVDYTRVTLSNILKDENDTMVYKYDFSDSWEHDIILEKIVKPENDQSLPVCISGERNCPPEECGGSEAYAKMVKIINDPKHKNYRKVMEWLGDYYDPEYFDKDEINIILQEENFGCPDYNEE